MEGSQNESTNMDRKLYVYCEIPFTTTGLSLAVSRAYSAFKSFVPLFVQNKSEFCTVHQLYRYTLAQFEYQNFLVRPWSKSYSSMSFAARLSQPYPENFACIVSIIDSFGEFTEADCHFSTVAPPDDVHSPHTVRLTNLRAIVERLSTEGDKDFMDQNTLPGARYDADGILQNPNDIMPPDYNRESFGSDDAQAVQTLLFHLRKYPTYVGTCKFLKEGNCSSLVSTALEKKGPYDSLYPEDGIQGPTYRDWYSIYHISPNKMHEGISLYCGVWSEKLEQLWPLVKVRHPGSSKQLIVNKSWSWTSDVFHNTSRSTTTEDVLVKPVTCRVPFTTTGLAFAVNDLYNMYYEYYFADSQCTIYQLYRYTLAQLEFQFYIVGQAQHQTNYYPYYNAFFLMYRRWNSLGMLEAYAENFKSIVTIIDSYGYFQEGGCNFGNIPPPIDVHHPDTIRLSNLRDIVEELAAVGNEDFTNGNTLPGARYNADGLLQNADEIMPVDYDDEASLSDALAVHRILRKIINEEEYGMDHVTKCQFSDKGQPTTLMSTSVEGPRRDSIPPISINDEQVAKKTSLDRRQWYSIYPINESIVNLGIMAYCGIWSESLEKKWPDIKVRNSGSGKQVITKKWNAKVEQM